MPNLLKSSLWLVSKISFPQDYDIGHPTPISFSSVGLIWFWAPGPLEEPQVHHQPGTFDISAVICRQKHHKKQECWYGEPCFSLETFLCHPTISHRSVSRTVHTTFHHSHLDARLAAIALLQTLCFHIKSAFFTWRFFLVGIFCPKATDQEGFHKNFTAATFLTQCKAVTAGICITKAMYRPLAALWGRPPGLG